MLNPKVGPLARHIIENLADQEKTHRLINEAIEEAKPKVIALQERFTVHLHERNGSELTGFLPYNGYQVDETRVFIEQVVFPHSMLIRWDKEIANGTMPASRLIDIPTMKDRCVLGYQMMRDEGVTIFHLEDWSRDEAISWQELSAGLEKKRAMA